MAKIETWRYGVFIQMGAWAFRVHFGMSEFCLLRIKILSRDYEHFCITVFEVAFLWISIELWADDLEDDNG
jgi:hypothetical protein